MGDPGGHSTATHDELPRSSETGPASGTQGSGAGRYPRLAGRVGLVTVTEAPCNRIRTLTCGMEPPR